MGSAGDMAITKQNRQFKTMLKVQGRSHLFVSAEMETPYRWSKALKV